MKNIEYIILVDTREKQNQHILEVFEQNNINYKVTKLDFGDYAIETVPKDNTDQVYRSKFVIERKANLDELLQNLIERDNTEKLGNRFHREMIRFEATNTKCLLLIEDLNYYENILKHNYRSQIKAKSARGLILSLEAKYDFLKVKGMKKELMASYIHSILYYALRQELK